MNCPHCHAAVGAAMTTCPRCGKAMGGGASLKDLFKAAIGPKSTDHYLGSFKAAQNGKQLSWHWPAFFVTMYWLLYRKMWAKAGVYFLVGLVCNVVLSLLAEAVPMAGLALSTLALLAFFLLPAMLANGWYYRHCKGLIRDARQRSDRADDQLESLAKRGGTSWVGVAVLAGFSLVGIGLVAAVALPAYQDYVLRSRNLQALAHASEARTLVANYYAQHERLPHTLQEAGFNTPKPADISSVDYDPNSGQIQLQMNGQGGSLVLSPTRNPGGQIVWACSARNIPRTQVPKSCQD